MQCPDDEAKVLYTKEELLSSMRTALGGRGAELLFYGEDGISTGSADDLSKATELAHNMLCSFGMYNDWGIATTDEGNMSLELFERINAILDAATKEAMSIIDENRDRFNAITEALMKNHCHCEKEIRSILEG